MPTAVALEPSVWRNWPMRLRPPSYVASEKRLTVPMRRTKPIADRDEISPPRGASGGAPSACPLVAMLSFP